MLEVIKVFVVVVIGFIKIRKITIRKSTFD